MGWHSDKVSDKFNSPLRRVETTARVACSSKCATTRAAGYSRPTFYQYFNDRHGFMAVLLEGAKGEIIGGAQPWLVSGDDSVASLRASLEQLVNVAYRPGTILSAVADASASDARLEQVWKNVLTSF